MKLEDVWEPRLQVVNQRGANALLAQRSRSIPRVGSVPAALVGTFHGPHGP